MNDRTSTDAQTTSATTALGDEYVSPPSLPPPSSNAKDVPKGDVDLDSEAETTIISPVKKAELAKQNASAHVSNTTAIMKDDIEADWDHIAAKSLRKSRESSEELSDVTNDSDAESSASSQLSHTNRANPRKRKHRASSVSLPNKRPSIDASRRRKRGTTADLNDADAQDRSSSPHARSRRHAASAHSPQENGDAPASRKRRSIVGGRESSKSTQPAWDEESISSEATSHGHPEQRRPQRGVGRPALVSGRSGPRETKRHVNKYGYTRLAEACEQGDLDLVKEWREKDPEQLEIAEFAGNKPLQIAAINGNSEVVKYLIDQGCRIDCENDVRDTPLIDAAENGHADVVDILLAAGVDPLRQNRKGQQALDVINDETDNVADIRQLLRKAIDEWSSDGAKQRREEEEEQRHRAGPSKELHFMARSYENLMRLVTLNDRNSVREFLDARVPVDNAIIAAAAKTGDLYLVNMLLLEMSDKKKLQKAEKPLLSVLGTSHFDMVKNLTELEQFNPRWTNRQGKSWSEIAAEKAGPMMRQEMELLSGLQKEADTSPKSRLSSSPVMRRTDTSIKNRRSAGQGDDDSDAPESEASAHKQRKNGRRLLSRKDMRVASRNHDLHEADGWSEEESPELDQVHEAAAHQQSEDLSAQKRGPGRPRGKSAVIKMEGEGESGKAGVRRRSLSHKKTSLPSVAEAIEAQPTTSESAVMTTEDLAAAGSIVTVPIAQTQLSAGQREENASDDTAGNEQEELDRQVAVEQERAQRQLEQQLQAEQDANLVREEEERHRQLAEIARAKNEAARAILESLPTTMALHLDDRSDFTYEELGAMDAILGQTEPLQVVYSTDLSPERAEAKGVAEALVLNLAVAPLLGKQRGIGTLLHDEHFTHDDWDVAWTVREDEKQVLLPLLQKSVMLNNPVYDDDEIMTNGDTSNSFAFELDRTAKMRKSASQAFERLLSAPMTMRWLSLKRTLEFLHPIFQSRNIETSDNWRTVLSHGMHGNTKKAYALEEMDFYESVSKHWQHPAMGSSVGWTDVKVVGVS